MANSIDKRIVEMQFDNSRFERNVSQSISTLDRLKQSLDFTKSTKGLETFERQANNVNFSGLERSIANIERRFSALGIAGATVISTLTNKAIGAVSKINNAVFGQMKSGGMSRALNLEHANFMLQGLLKDAELVNDIMKDGGPVQNAVKGTAYGLDAAANAAAQFVASGIKDTEKLETALTAISGAAAMTGSSYEDISRIFTTVAGNGRLMADQLNQFSARGINAAATLAEALGKTEAEIREMTSKGKISFDMFAEAMNNAFGEQAKKANETYTGALSNVKAALSRIGAKVATPSLEKLREVFVSLIDVINMTSKVLDPFIRIINNVIATVTDGLTNTFKQLDKVQAVVENVVQTMGAAIQVLYSIVLPIKRAFESLFPKRTIDDAISLTKIIRNFVRTLKLSSDEMVTVTRIFRGVFAVFDIIGQIISALIRVVFPASKGVKNFINSFANGAATLGDYIYALSKVLKETDAIYSFFTYLGKKLEPVKNTIVGIFSYISKYVKKFISSIDFKNFNIGDMFKKLSSSLKEGEKPIEKMGNLFSVIFGSIGEIIKSVSPLLGSFAGVCGTSLKTIGHAIETVLTGGGFKTLLALVNSAFLVTLGLDIAAFIHQIVGSVSKGLKLIDGIKGLFANVSTHVKVMTQSVKADMLVKIAKAIAIFAVSLLILSAIPSEDLAKGLLALTIAAAELMAIMVVFTKISNSMKDTFKLFAGGIGFAAIAAGILILAGAMKTIASIPADALDRSLAGITILILSMTAVTLVLGNFADKVKTGVVGIIAFATAVKIVASAMEDISSLSWEEIVKGLAGITVAMLELSLAAIAIGKSDFGVGAGIGILLMAESLKVIGSAMGQIGSMDPSALTNSLIAMAAALAEIAVFMTVMGDAKHLISTAAAIGILSLAIVNIAKAIQQIGSLSPSELVTALIGIGGAFLIIGGALLVLSNVALKAIGAAAAIAIICISLNALIPILTLFANMDLAQLGTTLLGFAGAFTVLGVAAAIFAAAAAPMLIGAGVIAVLGAACLVSAAGMAASAISIGLLVSAFEELATLDWLDLLSGIGKLAITFTALALASALLAPTVGVMVGLSASLIAIGAAALMIGASISVAAIGLSLMADSLKKFETISWEAIGKGLLVLAGAVAALVVAGLALAPVAPVILAIGIGIGAMGAGLLATSAALVLFGQAAETLGPILNNIAAAVSNFAVKAWEAIKNFFDNFWDKLVNFGADLTKFIIDAGAFMLNALITASQAILKFLVKLGGELLKALGVPEDWVNVAVDFMNGLITGIGNMIKRVINKVKEVGKKMIDGIRDAIDSHSDSKETIEVGHDFDGGLITGILGLKDQVIDAVANVGQGMIAQAQSDADAVKAVWDGLSQAQQEGAAAEDRKRMAMLGYNNIQDLTRAGQSGLLDEELKRRREARAKNAVKKETEELAKNTGGTKSNTKAKKENEKANDKKTKAIDEESEALGEETEAAESNEEEIRALAEEIEVVTKAYDKLLDTRKFVDQYRLVKRQSKILGQFWSQFKTEGWTSVKQVEKAFKKINQSMLTTSKYTKKGVYAFKSASDDYIKKYGKKYTEKHLNNEKAIKKAVEETGRTIAKVYADRAKVYSKTGSGVEKMTIRLTKNVKNLAKYATEAKNFAKAMGDVYIYGEKMGKVEDFVYPLRNIQKYFVNLGSMPGNVKKYLQDIRAQFYDFHESMRILNKAISGDMSIFSGKNEALPYVEDAFISLASTLYDGSEAANEYATEHARLLFLMENGLATAEEVEEHYQSYIQRITDALKEYYNTLQETLSSSLDIWSEFDRKTDDQTKDFLSTIDSQLAGYQQWSEMLMEVSKRGIDFDLLKELTDSGVQSFGKLKNLLTMTENEFAYFNLRYMESQQVAKMAADMALAALANARTMATARAASASGKLTKAQLKQSKAAAKSLAYNNRAVARYQARYEKMNERQEKEYLKSLTKEQKAEYKRAKREEQKRVKTLKAKAATEEAKRSEENRIKTILEGIKTFEDYSKVLGQYANDTKTITALSEFCTKAFKGLEDVVSDNTEGILNFADVLDESGEEGLNYFEEMAKRIQKLKDEIVDSVKSVNLLTTAFGSAEKISGEKIMNNMLSQIYGNTQSTKLFQQLATKGYTSYVIKDVIEQWKSDHAAGNALIKELLKGDQDYIDSINAGYEKIYGEDIAKAAIEAGKRSSKTLTDYKKATEAAQKVYNDAVAAENSAKAAIENTAYAKEQKQKAIDDKRLGELKNILKKKGKLSKAQEKEYIKLLKKYGGKYKGTVYATLNDALSEKIKLDAYNKAVADYNKAVSTRIEKLHELEKAQEEHAREEERVNELIANNEKKAEVRAWFNNIISSVENVKKALKSMGASTSEIELLTAKVKSLVSEFKDADLIFRDSDNFKAIKEYADKSEPFGIMADGLYQFGVSITDANTDAQEFFETLKQGLKDYEDQLNSSIKSSSDFFSMFKGFSDEDNPLQATDYLEYAESQKNALIEWQNLLKTVTDKGLDKELVEKFASQGLGSYEQLSAWAKASAAQIGEYNQLWRDYQTQVENATNTAMASIAASWSDAGQVLSESMIKYFNNAGADRLKEAGYEASAMVITGVKDGLTNAMPTIISAVEHTDTSGMSSAIGKSIGTSINTGLVEAISGSVNETVSTAVEKFKMAVDSVLAYANEVLPTDYTITIHVDTSEIDAAVARMNAAIAATNVSAGQTSAAVTSSVTNQNATTEPITTEVTPNAVNLNYVQNNYSPKALDQVEIYRNTQNQLNSTRDLIELQARQ